MGGHGNLHFAFNLVVKLSVELGYTVCPKTSVFKKLSVDGICLLFLMTLKEL
jgi:hypothetical protein